eukprot:CAMPEP_0167825030 /NCGR_PEP_ID=MMETSP0112_2-20121227/9135_1 /TAXON_ID=91324 /ORGANISM="Lotharella globosa, Strain CCCM811" /LENGTH=232 /DNA_ID=CAMNT_0007727083 /DNA_START=73 /DNA_END=772 /DNA_ORIENTATION=-
MMERFATPVPPPPQPTGRSTWNRQLKGMAVLVSAALPFSLGSGEEQKSSRQSKPEATESVNGWGGGLIFLQLSLLLPLPALTRFLGETTPVRSRTGPGRPNDPGQQARAVREAACARGEEEERREEQHVPRVPGVPGQQPEGRREEREEVVLSCSHGFHRDCLATWLKTKDTCPMCRETLRSPKRREIAPRARPIAWTPPEYVPLTHVPRDDRVALQTHLRGDPLLIDPWMF